MKKDFSQKTKKIIMKILGLEEYEVDTRDPSELTEAELWVRDEIELDRLVRTTMSYKCFGLHYSESYLRSKPAEEIYAQWQEEVASLEDYIEECMRKSKERSQRQMREQAELEQKRAVKKQKRAARVQRIKSWIHS